ncbi:HDA3 HDA1 complex subunit 3 [Candida maltosa Xu316]
MNLFKILDTTPEPPIIDLDIQDINYSGDYQLSTPMYDFQKELIDQIISLHYPDILKYCELNDSRDIIIKSLNICIDNCLLVCSHPYLLIDHYMPKNLTFKELPSKLSETSGKFNVLKDLINVLFNTKNYVGVNVGIVMNNAKNLFDLVDALLLGCNGINKNVKRYVGNNVLRESKKNSNDNGDNNNNNNNGHRNSGTNSYVHLIPHDGATSKEKSGLEKVKFDLLIVLDGTVDTKSDFFKGLRSQNRDTECVIIRLVPTKTIEHVKLHYAKNTEDSDYLYKLISSIVCLRDFIGQLSPDIFPIYNQKLNYLSTKFFDKILTKKHGGFPGWPLPPLPKIPIFTPYDVERSLLTEVHFHYTPYGHRKKVAQFEKPSFYETRRLKSEYITNPLENSYNLLSGIYNDDENTLNNSSILTHKLLLQLNESFLKNNQLTEEISIFDKFNEPEIQDGDKIGRREKLMRCNVSNIINDVEHSDSRIASSNKMSIKKSESLETTNAKLKEQQELLEKFLDGKDDVKEENRQYITKQLEIWKLGEEIKNLINKTKSKNDEKNFTLQEYNNCVKSIEGSNLEIEQLASKIDENKRKYANLLDEEEVKSEEFITKKQKIINELKEEELINDSLKFKLNNAFKFLKDTSHLKKRKGRGLTPK